ncbi:hypothetical protein WMY93_032533 [Mugilogobius chulae]|uniref:ceramide glucosyltransferase n=1 Tax=Mugilogobius chulae TaxID=88201 RepID=A0AAW0MR53_9GOBI
MPGYESAKYGLVWVCDSGIRVKPDTLTDMTNQMTEKVGLVHGLPYVADRQGFAATLEQVYFGTSHPRSYISANVTGIKCVTGMSCLMRKDVLDQAGGLVAFAQYIAEDYFMAKAIADRGWKFSMATQVAMQNSGSYSIAQFQSRMIRWTKLRINMLPGTVLEPVSECFLASLIIGWAAHYVFRWDMMVFFMCHCLAWFIFDYIQLTGVQGGLRASRSWTLPWPGSSESRWQFRSPVGALGPDHQLEDGSVPPALRRDGGRAAGEEEEEEEEEALKDPVFVSSHFIHTERTKEVGGVREVGRGGRVRGGVRERGEESGQEEESGQCGNRRDVDLTRLFDLTALTGL